MIRKNLFLLVAAVSCLLNAAAQAQQSCDARAEFFWLKAHADSQSFIEQGNYAIVKGTDFIALEVAYNANRSCVYGFDKSTLKDGLELNARTRFVCFDQDDYSLSTQQEHCFPGKDQGCFADPGAISIGIGNIKISGPTLTAMPQKTIKEIFNDYPKDIAVTIIEEAKGLGGTGAPALPELPENPMESLRP